MAAGFWSVDGGWPEKRTFGRRGGGCAGCWAGVCCAKARGAATIAAARIQNFMGNFIDDFIDSLMGNLMDNL